MTSHMKFDITLLEKLMSTSSQKLTNSYYQFIIVRILIQLKEVKLKIIHGQIQINLENYPTKDNIFAWVNKYKWEMLNDAFPGEFTLVKCPKINGCNSCHFPDDLPQKKLSKIVQE